MTMESLSGDVQDFLERSLKGLDKPIFGVDRSSIGHINSALSGFEDPTYRGKRDLLAEAHGLVETGFSPPKVSVLDHVSFWSHLMSFPGNDFANGRLSRFRVKFAEMNCLVTAGSVELGFARADFSYTREKLETTALTELPAALNLERPNNAPDIRRNTQVGIKLLDSKGQFNFHLNNETEAGKYAQLMVDTARLSAVQYAINVNNQRTPYKITIENDRSDGSKPGIGLCLPREITWNRDLVEKIMKLHKDYSMAGEFDAYYPELAQVLTDLCQSDKKFY